MAASDWRRGDLRNLEIVGPDLQQGFHMKKNNQPCDTRLEVYLPTFSQISVTWVDKDYLTSEYLSSYS